METASGQAVKLIPFKKDHQSLTDRHSQTFITLNPEKTAPNSKIYVDLKIENDYECILDKLKMKFLKDTIHPLPTAVNIYISYTYTSVGEEEDVIKKVIYLDTLCKVKDANFVFKNTESYHLPPDAVIELKFYHSKPIKIASLEVTTRQCKPYYAPEEKPVIYLYPPKPTNVTVQAINAKAFTFSYPSYPEDGWRFQAFPDGTFKFPNGRSYPYLFWEGISTLNPSFKMGYCVPRDSVVRFLEEKLRYQGLNDKELTDCITYWAPRMAQHPFTIVYFANQEFQKEYPLGITPKPDSHLAIFMVMKPSQYKVPIKPQPLSPFQREGFTVVEWGGKFFE